MQCKVRDHYPAVTKEGNKWKV